MSVISHCGIDYGIPTIEVQDDASATSFDATKVPTGQTIENVLNSNFAHKFSIVVKDKAMTLSANSGVQPFTYHGSVYLDAPTGYDHVNLLSVTLGDSAGGNVACPCYIMDYENYRVTGESYGRTPLNARSIWLCYND